MAVKSPQNDSFAAALTEVSERLTVLFREELELAKAEMTQKASSLARGGAAIAVGAVFGVFALVMGLGTLAWGLNSLLGSLWLGFLITFVLLLVLTIGSFLFARSKLKVGVPAPTMALDEAKKIRETVTTARPEDVVAAPSEAVVAAPSEAVVAAPSEGGS